jgi:gluconolactonase
VRLADPVRADFARIVEPDATLDVVFSGMAFGEGPVWNAVDGCLLWVDIVGSTIWRWVPGVGREVVMHPTGHANGMTLDADGRLLVAGWGARSIWRLELDGSTRTLVDHYRGQRLNSPNDIVTSSDGSIWFTDPSRGLFIPGMGGEAGEDLQRYLPNHPVFRLAPDGELSEVVSDMAYPNGLCFSPDETLLYVNDTDRREIRVFPVDAAGSVGAGRQLCSMDGPEPGSPDGMKCDVDGNVYVTGPGGIHVVDPDGERIGRIRLPHHATNFCFGDADWRSLYITTHEFVYRMRVGIPGVPVGPKP